MSRLDELIKEYCPDGVEYKTIGEICTSVSSGGTPNSKNPDYYGGNIPWLRTQEVNFGPIDNTGVYITEQGLQNSSAKWINAYCVIIAMYGATVGKVGYNTIPMTTNQACCNLDIDSHIAKYKYIYYALSNMYEHIKSLGQGSQTNINAQIVKGLLVPVPPLPVQEEIVRILDTFTELTAELQAELQARKKQYEYYKEDILTSSNGEVVSLAEIADISTGSSNTDEAEEDGLYQFFVRSQEPLRKNTFEYDEEAIITAGDGVGVGKVFHYVNGKYALHQRAYRIHPLSEKVNGKYLFYYFTNQFPAYIGKQMFQGSVPSIRRPMLNKFEVILPTLSTQQKIVDILDRFDSLCNDISSGLPAEIEARQKQYEYYRDKLLTFKPLA